MIAGYAFRARWWALAAAALACAAGIALGNWQARRAEDKRALGARLDTALKSPAIEVPATDVRSENYVLRRVAARGRFVPEHTIYLYGKTRRGRVGHEVITPLRLAGSPRHVLVNRGWSEAPQARAPQGEVRIEGIALERLPRVLQLRESPAGAVRQNLEIEAFAAETGLRLQPFVIEQHSDSGDGLSRDWPRPDAGIEKHQGYALQWYSLAALALVLAIVFSFRRVE